MTRPRVGTWFRARIDVRPDGDEWVATLGPPCGNAEFRSNRRETAINKAKGAAPAKLRRYGFAGIEFRVVDEGDSGEDDE